MGNISLKKVRKAFGDTLIIPGADLDIIDGEFVVFVGPSGCGKSTLLRMIAGLEDLTSGSISIEGRDVSDVGPADRGLAMVFQSYALYPHMSVRNNIAFPLKMAKMPKSEIDAKVNEAAKTLNLTEYLDRKPGQLSGGQRQRVAIGRAIVRNPRAFLFDEPLSNLDAALRVNMRIFIMQLHKDLGATSIYVTHDQVEAMTMADRIVVLNRGVIEQVGSPLELYNNPNSVFVAGFIGSPKMNLLGGTVTSAAKGSVTVELQGGNAVKISSKAALKAGDTVTVGIRPEGLALAPKGELAAVAKLVEHLGSETLVYAEIAGGTMLTVKLGPQADVKAGAKLRLTFDGTPHLFDAAGKAII